MMLKLSRTQQEALATLAELGASKPNLLLLPNEPLIANGMCVMTLRLPTKDLSRADDGLPLQEFEDFLLHIPAWFPYAVPLVTVDHGRFAGYPHVIGGNNVCVYLDPIREWNPNLGIIGFLNRLWEWLDDAAAARFDASTALFHPVGGVLHHTAGTPTVVVRSPIPKRLLNRGLLVAALQKRTTARFDIAAWRGGWNDLPTLAAPVILLPGPLVYGAGVTLEGLMRRVALVGFPRADHIIHHIYRAALDDLIGEPLYLVIGARNSSPHLPRDHHLLVARIADDTADQIRSVAKERFGRHGVAASFGENDLPQTVELEWCRVSDERTSIAIRRDASRPSSWFLGKDIEIWGCGGIGSWIAEAIVRAGARRVILRDHGFVTSGLLVRQNYVEEDVGLPKAEALAGRLRSTSDQVDIEGHVENVIGLLLGDRLPKCDLIIDATVNTSVSLLLERVASEAELRPALAAMALDTPTATLGLLMVATPSWNGGPYDIERRTCMQVLRSAKLETFHIFWQPPEAATQVVPERGCSVPTFHGSAGDLMGVAATALDLLARRLQADRSGLELFASAHAALGDESPRRYRVDPPPVKSIHIEGQVLVRVDPAIMTRIFETLDDQESRVLLLGEYNGITKSLWIDDVMGADPNTNSDDIRNAVEIHREASYGLTAYVGDVIYQTGTEEAEIKSRLDAVTDAGGSVLLTVSRANETVRIDTHIRTQGGLILQGDRKVGAR